MFTFFRRIFFFLAVNIAVLVLISVVFALVGYFFPGLMKSLGGNTSLLIYSAVFGFSGAVISLCISRWIAKRSYNITLVDAATLHTQPASVQSAFRLVQKIAQKEGIDMPEFGVYEAIEPNAFATGATKNSALVAVSTGLLNSLETREVEGVIGHEMAHILNGDMVTLTLLQGVMNTFVIFIAHMLSKLVVSLIQGQKDEEEGGMGSYFLYHTIVSIFEMALGLLASLVIMWFSRVREYRADIGGSNYAGKASMIAALKRLQSLSQLRADAPVSTPDNLRAFMIHAPDSVFSTHPSLDNRIAALEKNYQLH